VDNKIESYYDSVGEDYYTQWKNSSHGIAIIGEFERAFVVEELEKVKRSSSRKKGFKVLDVGCGPGRIAGFCMEIAGVSYFGVDVSGAMISSIRSRCAKTAGFVEAQKCNAVDGLLYKNSFFDAVVSIRALKYNTKWRKIIADISRVLVPGGAFIFSFPNKYSLNSLSRGVVPSSKSSRSSIREISTVLKESGFGDVRITGGYKLPDIVYSGLPDFVVDNVALKVEGLLNAFFGSHFSRLLYISCKKK